MKFESIQERIEAIQWVGHNATEVMLFVGKELGVSTPPLVMEMDFDIPDEAYSIDIDTIDGEKRAIKTDWIIKHSNGLFSVCGNHLFSTVYVPIEDSRAVKSRFKKTVVFDFDGVVHCYKSGWDKKNGAVSILDGPVIGIREVIWDLRQDYKVVIVSTRCFQPGGIEAIQAWLAKYNIEVDGVLGEKPPAVVYVDDRAICFDGNTDGLATKVRRFKNWIEKQVA